MTSSDAARSTVVRSRGVSLFRWNTASASAGGVERWILDTGLPRFSGKDFDGYVGSAVDITRLGRARAELSNLSRHLMQAHERERAALAKTLHEDVCQRMVALTLRLHNLQGAAHDGEVRAVVADISEKLASLVGEIAAVSDPVHQRLELLGLTTAGRRFCEDLSARYDVAIHFQDEDVPRDLPSDIALALFRVLQEATRQRGRPLCRTRGLGVGARHRG